MENIEDLIFSEFTKVGYSVIGEIAQYPILANNDKSDFWIIVDDYDIDIEQQKNLAVNYGKMTGEYKSAGKNTSILVLKKVDNIDGDNKKWAVEIENDKFYFKKYVLLYTYTAWTILKDNIFQDNENSLSTYLVEEKNFENLKFDTPDGAYTLLYGIAHKLPFVLVEMKKSKLELSYPSSWSSSNTHETNEWVNRIPEGDNEVGEYLDQLLNSVGYEQD